jgi:hypothetical protein
MKYLTGRAPFPGFWQSAKAQNVDSEVNTTYRMQREHLLRSSNVAI